MNLAYVLIEDHSLASLATRVNNAMQKHDFVPVGGLTAAPLGVGEMSPRYIQVLVRREYLSPSLESMIVSLARSIITNSVANAVQQVVPTSPPPRPQHQFRPATLNPAVCGDCGNPLAHADHLTAPAPAQPQPASAATPTPHAFADSGRQDEKCGTCGQHFGAQVHHTGGVVSQMPEYMRPSDLPNL